jgi:arsenite methyltransferase
MCDEQASETRAKALREAVRERYRAVSKSAAGCFTYPVGRPSAVGLGYEAAWLQAVPPEVVDRFVGVGNPFSIHRPRPGDRVLDLGCGAGLDTFAAALLVGPQGRASGLDLSAEMLARARSAAAGWPLNNVEFVEGLIEALPFEASSFDLVISNGVLNLVPDKEAAFREIERVLEPGGRFAAVDLLVIETVPAEVLASEDAWST